MADENRLPSKEGERVIDENVTPKKSVMNLPNKLTIFRMVLIPVFIVFFYVEFKSHFFVSLFIFVVASLTDILDGKIARKRGLVTNFGKFLDPIADKVLVLSAFVLFLSRYEIFFTMYLNNWAVIVAGIGVALILARELIVSGFRLVASDSGVVIAADMVGKYKTVFQDVALVLFLVGAGFSEFASWYAIEIINYVALSVFAVAVILTIISGVNYIVKNSSVLKD